MRLKFDIRLLFLLIVAFIVTTIIGTVSHECGHYIAAKLMGFEAHINYSMTWLTDEHQTMNAKQLFWFTLAGPLQTMLTGTISLLCLIFSARSYAQLSFGKWCLVFISLFWLRQPANFFVWFTGYITTGRYKENGDEIRLSRYLNWSDWFITSVTAFAGLLVLMLIIFRFIPKSQRLTFLVSGIVGGISGYFLWLVYFGKMVMP